VTSALRCLVNIGKTVTGPDVTGDTADNSGF
jgi:hypothetical protein